jgi:hypothetical protein
MSLQNQELDKIILHLEEYMTEIRDKANNPQNENSSYLTELLNSEKLKNQVWSDYFKNKEDKVCSRCGLYNKYEIIEKKSHAGGNLNERYGYNFYLTTYELKTTEIRNKNSLADSDWGSICSKCKDHILGIKIYDLSSDIEEAEFELLDLRKNEAKRRLLQEDSIRIARKEANKALRENNEGEYIQHRKRGTQTNPNDIRNTRSNNKENKDQK